MQVARARRCKAQPEDEKIKKAARCIEICGEPSSCVTGSFEEFPATQKELTCDGAHLRADGCKLQIFSEKFFCVPEHDALRQFL